MNSLSVSILTPSFNQARWLPDNLASVAGQTYEHIEHVVSDGGSTDGSVSILEASSASISWRSASDDGQSDAINRAFARSHGDIIGWINSDDAFFSKDVVAEAVRVFDADPSVGVVYGHAALVNASGTLLQILWAPPYRRKLLDWYNYIYQPSAFIRRSYLGRSGLVDPNFDYMMDRELWLHLARRCRFHRLDRILAIDRHHLGRKSYTRQDLAKRDHELLVHRYPPTLKVPSRLVTRGVGVAFRLAGLTRLGEAASGSDTIPLTVPSAASIALRQMGQLRRWMPSDG